MPNSLRSTSPKGRAALLRGSGRKKREMGRTSDREPERDVDEASCERDLPARDGQRRRHLAERDHDGVDDRAHDAVPEEEAELRAGGRSESADRAGRGRARDGEGDARALLAPRPSPYPRRGPCRWRRRSSFKWEWGEEGQRLRRSNRECSPSARLIPPWLVGSCRGTAREAQREREDAHHGNVPTGHVALEVLPLADRADRRRAREDLLLLDVLCAAPARRRALDDGRRTAGRRHGGGAGERSEERRVRAREEAVRERRSAAAARATTSRRARVVQSATVETTSTASS